jgi:predicted dinucleotide-binding enzyme
MKIAVVGTGVAGYEIGSKLVALGHDVMMGSRSATHEKAVEWVKRTGSKASQGTFADAAAFGEIAFNCTNGEGAVAAVQAGAASLKGKIVIDITNPLDFSRGFPPALTFRGEDSLGEQIQRAVPDAKVVKSLNTVNCKVMVNPALVKGDHDVFVGGNDAGAKAEVTRILRDWFGWKSVVDLGDITTSRGVEGYLLLWVRLFGPMGGPNFNIKVMR